MNYTDSRDGKVYPCVQMPDGKWWFAKNLSYASENSHPYNDDPINEAIYGRLYPWDDLASACPSGCHIPTDAEWTTLINAVGGSGIAGGKLKANSSLWIENTGTDDYGFSVLPAGYRYHGGAFVDLGNYADFWTSSDYNATIAYFRNFGAYKTVTGDGGNNRTDGFSLRCIVDTAPPPIASPTATPSSGMYSKYQVISLESATEGAVVYYTTDGSTPSASSSTAPIVLLKAFTLKAIAIKDGQSSEIATFEYSIGDSFMDVVPKRSFSNSIPVRTIYAYDIGNADLRGVVDYYAIKQSIKNIISTPKGTAIRDLTFGTSIYDIIYDIYTDGDEAAIVSSLKSDIESCDSRVTISSHLSTASFNKSTRMLSITLVWSAPLINDQKLVISIPV